MDNQALDLRKAFRTFLGEEQFRKFAKQGGRLKRLRYWQEIAWQSFVTLHPEFSESIGRLPDALRVCELHGDDLQPDTVAVIAADLRLCDAYLDASIDLFPHAETLSVSTDCAPLGTRFAVWFCPACREAEGIWQANQLDVS